MYNILALLLVVLTPRQTVSLEEKQAGVYTLINRTKANVTVEISCGFDTEVFHINLTPNQKETLVIKNPEGEDTYVVGCWIRDYQLLKE